MYRGCQSDEVLNNNLCCNNLVTGDKCKYFEKRTFPDISAMQFMPP